MENDYIIHSGIKDQRWGRRRWQNDDGSFNEEGKIRYGRIKKSKYFNDDGSFNKRGLRRYGKSSKHHDELTNEQLIKLKERQDIENSVYESMQLFSKEENELTLKEKIEIKKLEAEVKKAQEQARQEQINTRSKRYDVNNKNYELGAENAEKLISLTKGAVGATALLLMLRKGLISGDDDLLGKIVGGKK